MEKNIVEYHLWQSVLDVDTNYCKQLPEVQYKNMLILRQIFVISSKSVIIFTSRVESLMAELKLTFREERKEQSTLTEFMG